MALLSALQLYRLLPRGFTNRDLRQSVSAILGLDPGQISTGQMTYDLRRLRLHGLIERVPRSHRYIVTDFGLRAALFLSRAYTRLIRPGMAVLTDEAPPAPTNLRAAFDRVDAAIDRLWQLQNIAA